MYKSRPLVNMEAGALRNAKAQLDSSKHNITHLVRQIHDDGVSFASIAKTLGCSRSWVHQIYHSGMK